ncbi:predicted protein [Coccidioides posadasii str. Silveira]|uniref:Predicted protein n=1 Tax=Coccidioides posadasii (strain RMSCC 757 / Silveira) TaxID=443226 RepID=E9CYT5_COCPS|nr:predicted protein [Coccidioides posadasii str. Silveira]
MSTSRGGVLQPAPSRYSTGGGHCDLCVHLIWDGDLFSSCGESFVRFVSGDERCRHQSSLDELFGLQLLRFANVPFKNNQNAELHWPDWPWVFPRKNVRCVTILPKGCWVFGEVGFRSSPMEISEGSRAFLPRTWTSVLARQNPSVTQVLAGFDVIDQLGPIDDVLSTFASSPSKHPQPILGEIYA